VPGAARDTLKKLRILIKLAIDKGWLKHDPSAGITRPKGGEIRAWTAAELAAFEKRWPLGTKQRTAFALILNMGVARVDTHLLTWTQAESASYRRQETGVAVQTAVSEDLEKALAATPRTGVYVLMTEWGGRSQWTDSLASCGMRSRRRAFLWNANRTVCERPLGVNWPTPKRQRTTSWQRSATPP
jgi:hypothetical protein